MSIPSTRAQVCPDRRRSQRSARRMTARTGRSGVSWSVSFAGQELGLIQGADIVFDDSEANGVFLTKLSKLTQFGVESGDLLLGARIETRKRKAFITARKI